jgi:DNA-binding NtrC family response regulator
MNPRIVALSGPLKGSVFLIESDVLIGRSKACHVVLDDTAVAPRQCWITREGDYVQLADLITACSTYVNGFVYYGKALVQGDRIRVGRSIFAYLTCADDEVVPAMLTLTAAEQAWEKADPAPGTHGYEAPNAVVIETLLQIGASINGMLGAAEIQSRVFEWIFRVVPVERVAILLAGGDRGAAASITYRRIGSQADEPFPIDEALTEKALRDGVAGNGKVICVPMAALATQVGLIYAVLPAGGFESFTNAHLQLLQSIAGSAAVALEHARTVAWLEGENRRLKESISVEHEMVGGSDKMQEIYKLVAGAAPSDVSVFITGESGTGKELVARAIHRNSPRSQRPYEAANCSAYTEALLSSELFGHEKGAFTGADRLRKGLFEIADGGTVFLDEVGDCPLTMQADLLRLLQHKEFKRVGGNQTIKVDIRVIAATNVDIEKAMKEGRFRPDLFFRLNVVSVHMPQLAERREDIPALAAHFIKKYGYIRPASQTPVQGIAPETYRLFASYAWPGNVRELENAIQRAVALGKSPYIGPEDLPKTITAETAPVGRWDAELDKSKKGILERALRDAGGNRNDAAQLLDLHPKYFAALCKEFNVVWRQASG